MAGVFVCFGLVFVCRAIRLRSTSYSLSMPAAGSRFIKELPEHEIRPEGAVAKATASYASAVSDDWEWDGSHRSGGGAGSGSRQGRTGAGQRRRKYERRVAPPPRDPVTDEDGRYYEEAALAQAAAEDLELGVGDLVTHPKFGRGRVESIDGYGETAKITVAFSGYGRKKLVAAYAKLQRAE